MSTKKTCNGPIVVPDAQDRIVLERFTRIGDRVMMAVSSKDEGWSRRAVLNGIQGTVIGYRRYRRFQARIGIYLESPGEYERNGAAIVRWDSGEFDTPSMHDVVFVDVDNRRTRMDDTAANLAWEVAERVGELPALPVWEHDLVRFLPNRERLSPWPEEPVLMVTHINYEHLGDVCNDGTTPYPVVQIEPRSQNQGRITVRLDDIELADRGNVWWWHHDKDRCRFVDLRDEVAFHRLLGLATQVRNPTSQNYSWNTADILAAATAGLIDVCNVGQQLFSINSVVSAYKLHDADLSARANAALIAGFTPATV